MIPDADNRCGGNQQKCGNAGDYFMAVQARDNFYKRYLAFA